MLRVRRRENDEWSVIDVAKHVGAEQPGHLHVEKHELRPERLYAPHRRLAVGRLADDFNPVEGGQHAFEAGAGNRLIVDDEDGDRHPLLARFRRIVSTAS